MRRPQSRWMFIAFALAFALVAFVLLGVLNEYELSTHDLLAGTFDPIEAMIRSFQVHLWSLILLVTLCLIAAVRLHGLYADLGRALAASERQGAELQTVNDLSQTLSGRLDPTELAFEFVRAVQRTLDDEVTAALFVFDEAQEVFRSYAEVGPRAGEYAAGTRAAEELGSGTRDFVLNRHSALIVPDTSAPDAWAGRDRPGAFGPLGAAASLAIIPLVAHDSVVATLALTDDRPGRLVGSQLRLATILAATVAGGLLSARSLADAEARAQREQVTKAVADLTLTTLDANAILRGAAAILGEALKASRALVWLGTSPTNLRLHDEWRADGVASAGAGLRQAPIARLSAREGRTIVIGDLRTDTSLADPTLRLADDPTDPGDTLAAQATPIVLGNELVGALVVEQVNRTRGWNRGDRRLLEAVARELRVAVETVRMFEARRHESERMVALSRVSAVLAAQTDPSTVLEEVMKNAARLLGHASGSLFIWVEEAKVLRAVRHYNMPEGSYATTLRSGQGVAGKAFADVAPVIVNDVASWEGASESARKSGPRSALAVPLVRSGQPLGTLVVHSFGETTVFTNDDARLLTLFADQVVSALTNAEAFQKQAAAVDDLERLSKAKSDFISIVSHEFRTPLTGIQGFAEMMRDEELTPEEMREYAGDIYKDARRLNRMINEMLDLDRMESGRMTLNRDTVDLNEIIRDTIARAAPNAPQHPISADLQEIPGISADRDKLIQVMTNLLSNAVKYSPDGGAIQVASRLESDAAHVTVTDHGMGIPTDALEKIFERFSRIETGTTRYIQGTGLGLPIVRQIVEMHGGRAWAESTLGSGSTFHVTLPVRLSANPTV